MISLMHARRRMLVAPLAALMLVGSALALATAAPASAATGPCSGVLVSRTDVTLDGRSYGTLDVYYDSAKKKNCARTVNGTGVETHMSVFISVCWGSLPCSRDDLDNPNSTNFDSGDYTYYAGPVYTRTESDGRCIHAFGVIDVGSRSASAVKNGHCG